MSAVAPLKHNWARLDPVWWLARCAICGAVTHLHPNLMAWSVESETDCPGSMQHEPAFAMRGAERDDS